MGTENRITVTEILLGIAFGLTLLWIVLGAV
jgi:hypothetical protein